MKGEKSPRSQYEMEEAKPGAPTDGKEVSSRELAVSLENLYSRGVMLGLAQMLVPAAIPLYDYMEVYGKEDRLYPYTFVFIGANLLVGLLGMVASSQRRSFLLVFHVASALVVGCVVGGLSLLLSHVMVLQCNLQSKTFEGCNELTCSCLADDSCVSSDFDTNIGCSACKAYPNDICSYFDYDNVAKGFNHETYKVFLIVLMNIVSASHSLLIFVRKEHFDSIQSSRKELIQEHLKAQELWSKPPPPDYVNGGAQPPSIAKFPPGSNLPPPAAVASMRSPAAQVQSPAQPNKPEKERKEKKEKKKKKKAKSKISPVTSFENGGTEAQAEPQAQGDPIGTGGGIFNLGRARSQTERNTKMIEQTDYERLRNSVSTKKEQPQAQNQSVENDLGIEDVDDFLQNLM